MVAHQGQTSSSPGPTFPKRGWQQAGQGNAIRTFFGRNGHRVTVAVSIIRVKRSTVGALTWAKAFSGTSKLLNNQRTSRTTTRANNPTITKTAVKIGAVIGSNGDASGNVQIPKCRAEINLTQKRTEVFHLPTYFAMLISRWWERTRASDHSRAGNRSGSRPLPQTERRAEPGARFRITFAKAAGRGTR